jgi:hypothetical protein
MAKKRSMADLPLANVRGRRLYDVMPADARKRFDELMAEYMELESMGRSPKIPDACQLLTEETGFEWKPTTFKSERDRRRG